jgi:hypothetical protein
LFLAKVYCIPSHFGAKLRLFVDISKQSADKLID